VQERLGEFYLGKKYDIKAKQILEEPVLYDARDLTTHAVCIGMTGSGKTGLCIDLLEEAALDGIPVVAIDPKGDLTNMLLTFPDLQPASFLPWINEDDARRKGMTEQAYAEKTAKQWAEGLAQWGEGPDRIRKLQDSAEFVIFTPGSEAGIPVNVLRSLQAPGAAVASDPEALVERIEGTVSALLGLAGIKADPIQSREHILMSTIFQNFWQQGKDLDIATLIGAIQNPPVRTIGVFDVDTFYPAKDRFGLAMALNNIIAAPSFQSWIRGVPLSLNEILKTREGKPRVSVFYIAHLSDAERMFFVTLLLEEVLNWVRQQSGTTSLRGILYFDEVFGYFPPVENPPSKKPLMTLMKQARAFGFGVMLTTQNPVDLDYKGLTNAGTWMIGKLQTDRDKMRVLEGMESASASAGQMTDRSYLDKLISSLDSRVFILHDVHAGGPVVFMTRWAMSYLRGPLTRPQIKTLMDPIRGRFAAATPTATAGPVGAAAAAGTPAAHAAAAPTLHKQPPLEAGITQVFLPIDLSPQEAVQNYSATAVRPLTMKSSSLRYTPMALGHAMIRFTARAQGVDSQKAYCLLMDPPAENGRVDWDTALECTADVRRLPSYPPQEGEFETVPSSIAQAADFKTLSSALQDYLYRTAALKLYYNPVLKLYSNPGETEREFAVRCQDGARDKRDDETGKAAAKFDAQLDRLRERLRKEEADVEKEEATYSGRKTEELLSAGESVVKLLFGRKPTSALSSASRKRRMTSEAKARIEQSKEDVERLKAQIADLQKERDEAAKLATDRWATLSGQFETTEVRPRKTDIVVDMVAVAWVPQWVISGEVPGGGQQDVVLPARRES
jgi:cell division protein FtsB